MDWFSVQLENGRELMLFQLRMPTAEATPTHRDLHRARRACERTENAKIFNSSRSTIGPVPKTRAPYPIRWRITVPSLHVELECAAAMTPETGWREDAWSLSYWRARDL